MNDFEKTVLEQLKGIKGDINELKSQVKENTAILKALEHSSEVNKAERDKMENDIAHMQGNIVSLKEDVSSIELSTAKNTLDVAKLKAVINQ
jgi:chromosome segregation ATPase